MTESEPEFESGRPDPAADRRPASADALLMQRVTDGDHDAFAQLVRYHTPRMYALARRLVGRPAEAEEILQEAFLRVWVHAASWSADKGAFPVWLARIVVNLCIDQRRGDRYEPLEDEEALAHPGDDPATQLSRRQRAERVAAAIGQLPLRQRTALTLCYYEGFRNAEAAEILGTTVAAVETLLIRARRTLRERLAPLDP